MNRALSYAWYQSFSALTAALGPDAHKMRIANTEKRIIGDLSGYRLEWLAGAGSETWAIAEDGDRVRVARVSNPAVQASPEFQAWAEIREYLTTVGG